MRTARCIGSQAARDEGIGRGMHSCATGTGGPQAPGLRTGRVTPVLHTAHPPATTASGPCVYNVTRWPAVDIWPGSTDRVRARTSDAERSARGRGACGPLRNSGAVGRRDRRPREGSRILMLRSDQVPGGTRGLLDVVPWIRVKEGGRTMGVREERTLATALPDDTHRARSTAGRR